MGGSRGGPNDALNCGGPVDFADRNAGGPGGGPPPIGPEGGPPLGPGGGPPPNGPEGGPPTAGGRKAGGPADLLV